MPDDAGVASEAARFLAVTAFPAVVVETSAGSILAASDSAAELLDPTGVPVVGRPFEDFTADRPPVAHQLLTSGRVTELEAVRVLRGPEGETPVRVWLRRFSQRAPSEYLLMVLVPHDAGEAVVPRSPTVGGDLGVAGTTDEALKVVQISASAVRLWGKLAADVAGRSLLSLVAGADRARALSGVAEAAETGCGITIHVDVDRLDPEADAGGSGCELVILPLRPVPSCFFVFLPRAPGVPRARSAESLETVLRRLGTGALAAPIHADDTGSPVEVLPGEAALTPREREVLSRLRAGQRVPAIAHALFLSESTIRTHVAAIVRKIGALNQQHLRELMVRSAQPAGRPRSTST